MTRNKLHKFEELFDSVYGDLARTTVGFDRIFDGFRNSLGAFDGYPPYNLEKLDDDKYRITLALAGFSKEELDISKVGNWLTVISVVEEKLDESASSIFLHKGIARRSFERKIQLADDIEVKGATMKEGLLHIDLARVVPEEKKAKTIKIK